MKNSEIIRALLDSPSVESVAVIWGKDVGFWTFKKSDSKEFIEEIFSDKPEPEEYRVRLLRKGGGV